MRKILLLSLFLCCYGFLSAQNKRPLRPGDIYKMQTLGDPQISPDGEWVAYTLSTVDSAKDRRNTDIYMISWDGKQTVQLTNSPEGESSPRWSPDGKYISFSASRQGSTGQVWLLDRRGGEAIKLTDIKGDLSDYVWSPDSKKLAVVVREPLDTAKNKAPKPYVIDRYRFKQDVSGYIYDTRYSHLFLFDVESKKLDTITKGTYNVSNPQWSPDGKSIAFVSNQTEDPDRNSNSDIWIVKVQKQNSSPPGREVIILRNGVLMEKS
jgi:Tol biopolymer transport system component